MKLEEKKSSDERKIRRKGWKRKKKTIRIQGGRGKKVETDIE